MTFFPDIKTEDAKNNFTPRELISEGPHSARIIGIVDLGLQENKQYGKIARKLNFDIVITDETVEAEGEFKGKMKHAYISFTNSHSELGGLYKEVYSKLGLKADSEGHFHPVKDLLDKPIQVTIAYKDGKDKNGKPKKFDNIAGFSQLHKSITAGKSDVEPYVYSLDHHNEEALERVPQFLQQRINFAAAGVDYVPKTKEGKGNADFGKG